MNSQNISLTNLRHSCSHLLAAAVLEHYPQAKLTIGPSVEGGFYYDIDFLDNQISQADLSKIEQKMHELVKKWDSFERMEVTKVEALKKYKENEYKQELINEFSEEGKILTFYKVGSFVDLCKGGHVENPSKELKYFKLLSIAGAYWKGDEKNKMLTRIYGTAFETKEDLEKYLWQLEEAKKRDHRKLGKEMGLFVFSDLVGPGLPIYAPKGALIRRLLQKHVDHLQKEIGYQEVWTPQVTKADLFKTSGHYDKYKQDMFRIVSNYTKEEYFLKPMNCPNHCVLYGSQARSYRDLPLRFSDFANLYRDEKPGELLGLSRLRAFSQDDGHCFCREDQVDAEFLNVAKIVQEAVKPFGMKYWIRLSLWDPKHPEKYLGDKKIWENAQSKLKNILDKNKIEYKTVEGEAAIYGPKLDLIAVDSLGREWQISTIQLDLIMAGRFGLTYTDQNGEEKTPLMIHRAILGSPERLMGLLIEHYAGKFPLWLTPVQVKIVPIADRHTEYCQKIVKQLSEKGIRVEIDDRSESMQKKIKNAQGEKVYFMAIVGDREIEENTLSIRDRAGKSSIMALSDLIDTVLDLISTKK